MTDTALEKLVALVAAWDPAFQCALFLVAVVVVAATACHAVSTTYQAFQLAVGFLRSAVTVPIGLFWGWEGTPAPAAPTPVAVTCTCRCECDGRDDEDDEDEDGDE